MEPVRIGLKLSQQNTDVAELRDIWQVADEGGFDHLWIFDHFAAIMAEPVLDVLEGWVLLGAMAEATSRVRIGCMVTGNTYRHPAVLAKMAVTIDHLSGGRLEFGIGAAWAEIEHDMLGIEFGTAGQRVAWLEEACQVIKSLFTEERTNFEGARYTLRDAIANPKPMQRPYPPFWIGGRGERKTLRVIAQHADVWMPPAATPTRSRAWPGSSTPTASTSAAIRPRSGARCRSATPATRTPCCATRAGTSSATCAT